MKKIFFVFATILFVLILMENLPAQQNYIWDVYVQVESGNEAHWISPEPVDPNFIRYYARIDAHIVFETWIVVTWVTVMEDDFTGFGETVGPIPPEGNVLFDEHIEVDESGIFMEADITAWIDGDGYLHVDVVNFTASILVRITFDGTLKIKESDMVYGDMNDDQVLDAIDLLLYSEMLAGMQEAPTNIEPIDMDCNGLLDTKDLTLIMNFIVENMITAYTDWDLP